MFMSKITAYLQETLKMTIFISRALLIIICHIIQNNTYKEWYNIYMKECNDMCFLRAKNL